MDISINLHTHTAHTSQTHTYTERERERERERVLNHGDIITISEYNISLFQVIFILQLRFFSTDDDIISKSITIYS